MNIWILEVLCIFTGQTEVVNLCMSWVLKCTSVECTEERGAGWNMHGELYIFNATIICTLELWIISKICSSYHFTRNATVWMSRVTGLSRRYVIMISQNTGTKVSSRYCHHLTQTDRLAKRNHIKQLRVREHEPHLFNFISFFLDLNP